MSQHDDAEDVSEPGIGWQLALLRHCVHETRSLAGAIEGALAAFDPDGLNAGSGVVLSAGALGQVAEDVMELQDLADLAGVIAGGLPSRWDSLVLSAEDVGDEAELALRAGSGYRRSVALSACLLRHRSGFHALADALASEPGLVSRWGTLTVRELLTGFRDGDTALTRRVCVAAAIHPDTEWADLDAREVARVADALRGAADA
ncbi:MAG TPA: hypothetical protein VFF79_10170 [Conexibacter sp.]|jgi:hypothetical protein|nr:hypothetical protein [Conexibacter sp.]